MKAIRLIVLVSIALGAFGNLCAREITVNSSAELLNVLKNTQDIDTVLLEPGQYTGGIYIQAISGRADVPITIRAADPDNPPVFSGGGGQAIHMADCSYVTLAHIKVQGYPANGINIDDGGTFDTPSHHIVLDNVTILDVGPTGNHDALKMSGVDEFVVKNCRFEGWGGSGIDMVGCHAGKITGCTFVGKKDYSQSNAVQLKGGTSDVIVEKCLFRNAGQRSVNLGGSTGLRFFRPGVDDYEATDITVAGNRFIGSVSPVAWVTAKGGHVHHNTIIFPDKWVLRILQETEDEQFEPCHGGIFENNLIIYDSRVNVFVNVGPRTAPETFKFRNNAWHNVDGDGRKPVLPAPEENGMYDVGVSIDEQGLQDGSVRIEDPELLDFAGAQSYQMEQNAVPVFTKIHTVSIHVKNHAVHEAVYRFLKDDLQLPVVYTPLTLRERKYAGIWAGNLVLEPCGPFSNITYATPDFTAMFYGITFEAYESSEQSTTQLDRRRIEHEPPYAFVVICDPNLCGENLIVSIMDNPGRDKEQLKHDALTSQLRDRQGGPLGIQYVEEIQVGCTDEQNIDKWKTFLAPIKELSPNRWRPGNGPAVYLVKSDLKKINAVVFKVTSLESAVRYLQNNNMLGDRSENSVKVKTPDDWDFRIVLRE